MDTETSRVGKLLADQAEEIVKLQKQIVKLQKQNAKLVEALQTISEWRRSSATQPRQKIIDNLKLYARLSITKATGVK